MPFVDNHAARYYLPRPSDVSGDKALRAEAGEKKVECRGVLWLLDQMEASGTIAKMSLAEGLQKIVSHPRCRLPKHDVNERLARWTAK